MMAIPAGNFVAIAGCPHYLGIGEVGNRATGLAASHRVIPSGLARVDGNAGPAHVSVVLHVAVEVVGNLVVHIDVVHLPDGQSRAMKTAAVNRGDVHAAIVGDDKAIGILRIDPDIVRVSAPGNVFEIFATVE